MKRSDYHRPPCFLLGFFSRRAGKPKANDIDGERAYTHKSTDPRLREASRPPSLPSTVRCMAPTNALHGPTNVLCLFSSVLPFAPSSASSLPCFLLLRVRLTSLRARSVDRLIRFHPRRDEASCSRCVEAFYEVRKSRCVIGRVGQVRG